MRRVVHPRQHALHGVLRPGAGRQDQATKLLSAVASMLDTRADDAPALARDLVDPAGTLRPLLRPGLAARRAARQDRAMRTITIDPITRLEGHGKISIVLDDAGEVERAVLQVPELRGFEAFVVGRPAEDMPQITSRICGICPTAHHMASTKALDDLYQVHPDAGGAGRPRAGLLVPSWSRTTRSTSTTWRRPTSSWTLGAGIAAQRLRRDPGCGHRYGRKVIDIRRRVRQLMEFCCGKTIHPVLGLPGGVAKAIPESERPRIVQLGKDAVDFALFSLGCSTRSSWATRTTSR